MRTRLVRAFLLFALLGAFAEVASAQVFCFRPDGFGNRLRITVTPMGGQLLLTGVENVFADRMIYGAAAVGVNNPGTYRLGFTLTAIGPSTTNSTWNVVLNAATGTGTYESYQDLFATRTSGTFSLISCAGVPDPTEDALPDILAPPEP